MVTFVIQIVLGFHVRQNLENDCDTKYLQYIYTYNI